MDKIIKLELKEKEVDKIKLMSFSRLRVSRFAVQSWHPTFYAFFEG